MSDGRLTDLDTTAATHPAAWPARFPPWGEWAFLLLLPLLTYWLFNYRPVHQTETLDPFFYTGYINNTTDLLLRFGLPYYSVRFGLILPGAVFTSLLGSEAGYLALRYVLSLVAGIPFYLFAKRHLSLPVAILSYVFLATSPWLARTLLWDHPDATGMPFLFAACCLILMDRTPSWWRDGAAGCFASLAINSNMFLIAILGIFGAFYTVLSILYGTRRMTLVHRAVAFLTGFVLVFLGGYLFYWHVFGLRQNIFQPSLDIVTWLNKGGFKDWRTPGYQWMLRQFQVLVLPLIAICCAALCIRRRMRFEIAVIALSGFSVVSFYYIHQFLLSADTLELFFYTSYSLPACFLMLAVSWQALYERFSGKLAIFATVSVLATAGPWLLVAAGVLLFQQFRLTTWIALSSFSLLVAILAGIRWRNSGVRSLTALAAMALLALAIDGGQGNLYKIARPFGLRENSEIDRYRTSLQLLKIVPRLSEHPGRLRFWYNSRNNDLNSIQSVHLWSYSKINQEPPADNGIPHLGDHQIKMLQDSQLRYLGLIGESPEQVQQGLDALTAVHLGYQLLDRRDLASGKYHYYWQLIGVTSPVPNPPELAKK